MLKITYAQLNYQLGDIEGNVQKMHQASLQAADQQSDLIVFSELALTGYFPGDLLELPQFILLLEQGVRQLLELSCNYPDLHMVVGAPLPISYASNLVQQTASKTLYNMLLVIRNGEIVLRYAKQLLPTYNVFFEARYFVNGPAKPAILTIKQQRIAFLICEDCWGEHLGLYETKPLQQLQDQNIDLLISINASPSNFNKQQQRQQLFQGISQQYGYSILWVNQIGAHDQIVYDGASFAIGAKQGLVYQAESFVEQVQQLNFNSGNWQTADGIACQSITEPSMPRYSLVQEQLSLALRDYMRRCGFSKVLVGSSGGIDSAITITLAAQAIGAENVFAITMPSRYSSAGSVTDSQQLCRNLGVALDEHPIASLVAEFSSQFQNSFRQPLQGLALENLQSRIRGTVLMAYCNQFGHLLLTTGNKSEVAVGYCTLYGDTNGGLNLIGDLYKTEVFEFANYLNQQAGRELIPQVIIDKEPSAELAPEQKDSDSLPEYEVLDQMLLYLLEYSSLSAEQQQSLQSQIDSWQLQPQRAAEFAKVKRLLSISEFKRFQAPPIVRLREKAFGIGRQMPIVAKHSY